MMKVLDPEIGHPSMMNLFGLAVGSQWTMSHGWQVIYFYSKTNRPELGFGPILMMGGLLEPAADFLSIIFPRL